MLNDTGIKKVTDELKSSILDSNSTLSKEFSFIEMKELSAFENGSKILLKELVLMDPWTRTEKQAEEFLEEILNLPWNKEMKEYYK